MTMPLIGGPITMGQINEELLNDKLDVISLNDTLPRTLVNKPTPSMISLLDFYGKSLDISNDNSWIAGGLSPYLAGFQSTTTVQRINFATDTAIASIRGSLSIAAYSMFGIKNSTYAWFGSGYLNTMDSYWSYYPAPSSITNINRITFASDMNIAQIKSAMPAHIIDQQAVSNKNDSGWLAGGKTLDTRGYPYYYGYDSYYHGYYWPFNLSSSSVIKITFASDNLAATFKAPLAANNGGISGISNSQAGWFAGGWCSADWYDNYWYHHGWYHDYWRNYYWIDGYYRWYYADIASTLVQKIEFAIDTVKASIRGQFPTAVYHTSSVGNDTYGWFAASNNTHIYRITFASDTVSALVRGTTRTNNGVGTSSDNYNSVGYFMGWDSHHLGGFGTSSNVDKFIFANDTSSTTPCGFLAVARMSEVAA